MNITETKGVVLIKPNRLDYKKIQLPPLGNTKCLIKVHSAVINPSDWYILSGEFQQDKENTPTTIGFEGSGLVVQTGISAMHLHNKRVAFHSTNSDEPGAFAHHTMIDMENCVELPQGLDYKHGAYFFVNPWSVETMMWNCRTSGWKCIVHTAAASALGRMLVNACKDNDITLINIVRRHEQETILKDLGAKYIVNSQSTDFVQTLERLMEELNPNVFYDAVTGLVGTKVFRAMPTHTTICMYGRLDGRGYDLDDDDMEEDEFEGKELRTFSVFDVTNRFPELKDEFYNSICKNLLNGKYKSEIQAEFKFSQGMEAFALSKTKPTKGKVLFVNDKF